MPRGPVREYLRAMGLHAAYVTTNGRAHSAAVPKGDISEIVWTSQFGARAIALHLNKGAFSTMQEAATGLRVNVIEHAEALRQVEAAVRLVNAALAHAKAAGEVRHFESAVNEYRRSAAKRGVRAMTYARAYTRLRAALLVYAATGKTLPPIEELIDAVLGTNRQNRPRPKRAKPATIILKFT